MGRTRIKSAQLFEYSVPFRRPFATSGQVLSSRCGLVIELESTEGVSGLGEIAPLSGFSRETLEVARTVALVSMRKIVGAAIPHAWSELPALIGPLETPVALPASVRFGLEGAVLDLASKAAHSPAARWINPAAHTGLSVNTVLTGTDTEIAESARSKYSEGYRTFKLKVGGRAIQEDVRRLQILRATTGADSLIRLDANRAWDFETANSFLEQVVGFSIEYIEEPLAKPSWADLARLRRSSAIPIALDESLPPWVQQHYESRVPFPSDVAIIKPPVIGGLTRGLELIEWLQREGSKCVVTSALDTGIGISAIFHLALAARLGATACGLDTLELLTDTLVEPGFRRTGALLSVGAAAGLGVSLTGTARNSLTAIAYEN